ncbi:unnamed protein product [Lactuca virosa]|uniref:FRIGIDA-like protein n=1 Tax=Lactuca virosa TaxID=75947 RepID=A0AAU9M2Z1_9ASTR|nr:unnamed protein product [Lactuca virosa]
MKARLEELSQRQVVFDEALEGLKQLRVLHEQTEKEAKDLKEEVVGLSERNRSLVADLSKSIGQQEELKKLNKDLQIRIDDALSHRALAVKELEGVSQQYHSFKSQIHRESFSIGDCLFETESGHLPGKSRQGAEELRWVVKEGIPLFFRALLDSSDFDAMNATLQMSSIQLGLHQDCVDMKEKYPEELKDKCVLYLYPDAQRQIIDRFAEMM